jgi:uncharacterized protein
MKQSISFGFLGIGLMIMILSLAGCGTSPPAKFYTLSSMNIQKPAEQLGSLEKYVPVAIGPVEIPDYLDRPEVVIRAEQNQLILSEFDLWGGALKSDINRVLIENISSLLAGDSIPVVTWKAAMTDAYRVPVVIHRFDASPNGNIILKSRWAVIEKEGKNFEFFRESDFTLPVKGGSYSALVSAMSEALGELSKEIATGIKSVIKKK